MKNFLSISFCLIVAVTLCSCQKAAYLDCKQTSMEFSREGGSQSLSFSANNNWNCSSNQSWCTISNTSGIGQEGSISVTVECTANTSYDDRTCTVTIKSAELSHSVTVTQTAQNGLLVSPSTIELGSEAQRATIEVKANVEFEVSSESKWIEVVSTKGLVSSTVVLNVFANETDNIREGKVTVFQKNGNLKQEVTVKQSARQILSVSEKKFEVNYESQTIEFEVKANVDYEIVIPDDYKPWISDVSTKGVSTHLHDFLIAENTGAARNAILFVNQKGGNLSDTVYVSQGAASEKPEVFYKVVDSSYFKNISDYAAKVPAFSTLSSAQQSALSMFLSLKFSKGSEKMRFYVIEYPSVDPKGNKVTLSASIMVPDKAFSNGREIDGLALASHYTVTKATNCPTQAYTIDGIFAWNNHVIVQPDYYGFGSSNEYFQAFMDDFTAGRNNIDAVIATEYFIKDRGLKIKDRKIDMGYSQGAYNALSAEKYASSHPELGISFDKIFLGSGPYSIIRNYEPASGKEEVGSMGILALSVISYVEHQIEGVKYDEIFKGKLLENYREWYFTKKYERDEIDAFIGTNKPSEVFTEALTSGQGRIHEAMVAACEKNSLCKDWAPQSGSKFYIYHSSEDELVPYENFEDLKAFFNENGGANEFTYMTGTGTHQDGMMVYITDVVLANW